MPPETSVLDQLITMAQTAGPFGTLIMGSVAWLLWKDSRRKDTIIIDLTRSGTRALTAIQSSLTSIHKKLDGGRQRRR